MAGRWLVTGIVLAAALAAPARAGCSQLILPQPPLLQQGRMYVPARPFCRWLGVGLQWQGSGQPLQVTGQGRRLLLARGEGFLARRGRSFLHLRSVAAAYGLGLDWRQDHRYAMLTMPGARRREFIPIWREPRLPPGLGPQRRQIWRLLADRQFGVGRVEPSHIRIVGRWASATLHPLNFITDDCQVLLERRRGAWQVLTSGTWFGTRNWGVPRKVRSRLGLWR